MNDPKSSGKLRRALDFTPEESARIIEYIGSNAAELLQIPTIRAMLAQSRFQRVDPGSIETFDPNDDGSVHAHALDHNFQNLQRMEAIDRPAILVYPLRGIEFVNRNVHKLKVLTIGPRSESEIFSLIAAGFEPGNITGLDLISYSDFVQVGDMHAMPFEDNSFDVVIAGWVLTYSADNRKAASEILRVARPSAHIAIGCATEPVDEAAAFERAKTATGGVLAKTANGSKTMSIFFNADQILRLFEGHIDCVLFRQDPHPQQRHERANATVIFRLSA